MSEPTAGYMGNVSTCALMLGESNLIKPSGCLAEKFASGVRSLLDERRVDPHCSAKPLPLPFVCCFFCPLFWLCAAVVWRLHYLSTSPSPSTSTSTPTYTATFTFRSSTAVAAKAETRTWKGSEERPWL